MRRSRKHVEVVEREKGWKSDCRENICVKVHITGRCPANTAPGRGGDHIENEVGKGERRAIDAKTVTLRQPFQKMKKQFHIISKCFLPKNVAADLKRAL